MCWLAGVSRAGYYRNLAGAAPEEEEMEVRVAIQQIALGTSSPLRLPSHRGRVAAAGVAGEPQARGSMDAGRQLTGHPAAAVRHHHRFAA